MATASDIAARFIDYFTQLGKKTEGGVSFICPGCEDKKILYPHGGHRLFLCGCGITFEMKSLFEGEGGVKGN